MAKTFHLTIAKVGENLFEGEAFSVSVPGSEGIHEILADHEPFVSRLAKGIVRVKTVDNETKEFEVAQGVIEVSHNQATILL